MKLELVNCLLEVEMTISYKGRLFSKGLLFFQ